MLKRFCELIIAAVSSSLFPKLVFGWFIVQGLFFALTTRIGLPPDENYHLAFIDLFANNHFSPFVTNQAEYLHLGEVVHTPYFLYHYLFGVMAAVVGNGEQGVIVLRLLNLLLGVGSLYMVYKIAGELKLNQLVRNLSLFMLSGTLMFVFLFASVSYDNALIFLSLASVLLLLKLLVKPRARHLLLLLICLAAGSLIKVLFLPLALAVVVVLAAKYRHSARRAWQAVRASFADRKRLNLFFGIVLLLLTLLVVQRYGYNLVKYQSLAPSCTKVMSLEECRQNAVFARNEAVYVDNHPVPNKDPFEYVYDYVPLVQNRTYGIFAHEELEPLRITRVWLQVLVLLAVVAVARFGSWRDRPLNVVLGVSLFYAAVVLAESYLTFLASGRFGFAVHGRYLFAVLPLLYLVSNHYIDRLLKNVYLKSVFIGLSLLLFVLAGLPTYLARINAGWYRSNVGSVFDR